MYLKLPLKDRLRLLKKKFFKPPIYPEAYFAYLNRFPNDINVSWFRDDGMIVGKVKAGDKEFVTQGTNATNFITMVNDALLAVFNIPEDYLDIVGKTRQYLPPPGELQLLANQI